MRRRETSHETPKTRTSDDGHNAAPPAGRRATGVPEAESKTRRRHSPHARCHGSVGLGGSRGDFA